MSWWPFLFVSLILFVVLLQLRYNGLLETIRIRRDGFSWRPSFEEFAKRSFKTSEYFLLDIIWEITLITRYGQWVKVLFKVHIVWGHGVICCGRLSGKDSDLLLFAVRVIGISTAHQGCRFYVFVLVCFPQIWNSSSQTWCSPHKRKVGTLTLLYAVWFVFHRLLTLSSIGNWVKGTEKRGWDFVEMGTRIPGKDI